MLSYIFVASAALSSLAQATSSTKRGLCHVPSSKHPSDDSIWLNANNDLTWYYNYKAEPSPNYAKSNMQFIPMLWGASTIVPGTPFLDSVKMQIASGANITYVLGFNEPDGPHSNGGSSISAVLAATTWKKQIEPLKELGIKLGAPAVTGSPNGFAWLVNFFNECDGGCNPDFHPVHFYGNFEGLASHVGQMMWTYPGKKIWVTEYGFPNQKLAATQDFYNTTAEWFDQMENITHYSYFGAFRSDISNVGPNSAMLTEKGELTDIGSWYLGGDATNNIPKGGDATRISGFGGWVLVVLGSNLWMIV